jgi:hypothetical protein
VTPETSRRRATFTGQLRRRLLAPVLVLAAILALLAEGRSVYTRAAALVAQDSRTRDARALPSRISYCNRSYLADAHATRSTIDATSTGFGVFPFRQVSSTADGRPIFAKPLPDSVRYRYPNGAPLPCSLVVYVKAGPDDYASYVISGGP